MQTVNWDTANGQSRMGAGSGGVSHSGGQDWVLQEEGNVGRDLGRAGRRSEALKMLLAAFGRLFWLALSVSLHFSPHRLP